MATQLKSIVSFVAIPPAGSQSLPHELNSSGLPLIPDVLSPGPSVSSFTITADDTEVTVTNTGAVNGDIDVLCEHWHTIERDFGPSQATALAPQPFVVGGAGGSGTSGLPTGYLRGMAFASVDDTHVSVGAGLARDEDDTFDIELAAPVTVNRGSAGAGGVVPAPAVQNTWYGVYAIADSSSVSPPSAFISPDFSAPALPAGYDKYRRVAVVRNQLFVDEAMTVRFMAMEQRWNGFTRRYLYDETYAHLLMLSAGTAAAFTAVDLSSRIPPSSRYAVLEAGFATGAGGAASNVLELRPTGASTASAPCQVRPGVVSATQMRTSIELATDDVQSVDYKVTSNANNTADLAVAGFDDEV